MVPVPKKDGTVRLCLDYRKVNPLTTPDTYTMPRTDDLLDLLGTAKYLTTLDMAQGYFQVTAAEQDRPNTAFPSMLGKFEFNRMPFGLRCPRHVPAVSGQAVDRHD